MGFAVNVLSGIFGDEVKGHLSEVEKARRSKQNHDIQRVINVAIAKCLRMAAASYPRSVKPPEYLTSIAASIEQNPLSLILATSATLGVTTTSALDETAITKIISGDIATIRGRDVLKTEQWTELLRLTGAATKRLSPTLDVSKGVEFCEEHFTTQLVQVLKDAGAESDPAWFAVVLRFLGEIHADVKEIKGEVRAQSAAIAALQHAFKTHAESVRKAFAAILNGCDPADLAAIKSIAIQLSADIPEMKAALERVEGFAKTAAEQATIARDVSEKGLAIGKQVLDGQNRDSAMLRRIHDVLVRNSPDVSASMRSMTVADCQLVVVRAILQAWKLDSLLLSRGWSVEYRWRPWSDSLLEELAEGTLDFAIYNTERTNRYIASNPHAPIVQVREFGYSMGGNHFYVLAKRGVDVDTSSIQRFKDSIRGGLIAIPHNSDIYENLALVGLTTQELSRLGVRTVHFDAHDGLRIFDAFPDALLIAGQNPRIQGLFRGEFEELSVLRHLHKSERLAIRARAANSLVIGRLPTELLGRSDVESLGLWLRQEFITQWTKAFEAQLKTLETYFAHSCNSKSECHFMLRYILFHTYRFGPPLEDLG